LTSHRRALLVEDFDMPPVSHAPAPVHTGCDCPRCQSDPSLPLCRADAFDAGRMAGRVEAADMLTAQTDQMTALVEEAIASADAVVNEVAETTADAIGRAVIAMVAASLPGILGALGAREAQAVANAVLPALRNEATVTIAAGSAAMPLLQPATARMPGGRQPRVSLVADEGAGPNDIRIDWHNGAVRSEPSETLARVRDVLAGFGLLPAHTNADDIDFTTDQAELLNHG